MHDKLLFFFVVVAFVVEQVVVFLREFLDFGVVFVFLLLRQVVFDQVLLLAFLLILGKDRARQQTEHSREHEQLQQRNGNNFHIKLFI